MGRLLSFPALEDAFSCFVAGIPRGIVDSPLFSDIVKELRFSPGNFPFQAMMAKNLKRAYPQKRWITIH
jgi:hypothetical protein